MMADVSRETLEQCRELEAEVRRWQKTTNLIAPSTLPERWERHILDSLQLASLVPANSRIVDVGSGGGFPALPLAIWQSQEGGGSVDAVESNRKKTSFLRQTARKLGFSDFLTVHSSRIEGVAPQDCPADIFTARALAALGQLFVFVQPWAAENSQLRCLFHKGREYRAEVETCRGDWEFDLGEWPSKTSEDARILEITHLQRKTPSR